MREWMFYHKTIAAVSCQRGDEKYHVPLDLSIASVCKAHVAPTTENPTMIVYPDERNKQPELTTNGKVHIDGCYVEQRELQNIKVSDWTHSSSFDKNESEGEHKQSPSASLLDTDAPISLKKNNVRLTLLKASLWRAFHAEDTEMIINKSGRRMFPHVDIEVDGLDPGSWYTICLCMLPANNRRYKYSEKKWTALGVVSCLPQTKPQLHPDSPALGTHWNNQSRISFRGVKLSNDRADMDNVVLESMHKYEVEVCILRMDDIKTTVNQTLSFILPYTEFIAVTAYQNDNITKLKIENNPFARAFKKASHSSVRDKYAKKRKLSSYSSGFSNAKEEYLRPPHDSYIASVSPGSHVMLPYLGVPDPCYWGNIGLLPPPGHTVSQHNHHEQQHTTSPDRTHE